ncbi:carbonic anhydrase [Halomicrobium sp. HM KBTZ05]|uniref:carbonic anhydrase n=1 Tax=Halomicrobium mukohataei TaxID=57705 RepID=A0A847U9I5_9EURY|nr:carbonic anhydrase [Halomicrobium mukohataei]NLV08907.1 carbonic anhydrase [Halomicrobium mukohataei]
MSEHVRARLLAGNRAHVESRPAGYFDEVQEEQHPAAVSICCADSRVSQEGMFDIDGPGWLFTPSNIGNQAWDVVDGQKVVNGNLLYPIEYTGTRTIAVVGHTGCGAVTAAYHAGTGSSHSHPSGIAKWIDTLGSVVADGLEAVDTDADEATVVNRLVEYNVDRQVAFLQEAEEIPDDVSVYGFVYDLHGAYDGPRGRTYLVNDDGETDPAAVRAALDEGDEEYAQRLTS